MTELETLERAKTYIDKMANGIDPLSDLPVSDDDVINNVRISRCLFYVSDVLGKVIENGGFTAKTKKKKLPFSLTEEQASMFGVSQEPIPISEITKRINALADDTEHVSLKHTLLTKWLIDKGLLQETKASDGKMIKRPTAEGNKIGIFADHRTGRYGDYTVVLYKKEAQEFLKDHLPVILEEKIESESEGKTKETGQPWTREDEDSLIDMFAQKASLSEIASKLRRSEGSVRSRLRKLGLSD